MPQKWLQSYALKLSEMNIFEGNTPNHVLINEYLSGQGIMVSIHDFLVQFIWTFIFNVKPHEDGPLFYPTVTTINTGSHTLLDFYPKISGEEERMCQREPLFSLFLEPRSLLVLKRDAYESYLHGIRELKSDLITDRIANLSSLSDPLIIGQELQRKTRLSFTIRYVPKVFKNNFIFTTKKF